MKIISTNIGRPTQISWNGRETLTGIYKYPVDRPLYLDVEQVEGDTVSDRRVHGGTYKACYLFSTDQYPYWREKYPHLDWSWGMFGENLSVEGLDETQLWIGNIYRLGSALVQVSQPREPCYKLGIRFGDQRILREFIEHGYPGSYLRILEQGKVSSGDSMELVEGAKVPISIHEFFQLLYAREKDQGLLRRAMDNPALSPSKRESLKKWA